MPHPLLTRLAPDCLHEGLPTSVQPSFYPWLRGSLRRELSGGDAGASLLSADSGSSELLLFLQRQGKLSPCTSTSEENGLRIEAVSGFVQGASDPDKGQYVFAYNMRFTNIGKRPLRVLARQYDFRETSGALASQIKQDQPEAAGVVGFTPLLECGASFEFGSGVVLRSPRGLVTGRFLVMSEPQDLSSDDAHMHEKMQEAELMLRFVYYKGLGTEQFHVPLGQLRFDADVACASLRR